MGYKIGEMFWQVGADTKQLEKGLKSTDKGAKGLGKTFSSLSTILTTGFVAVAVAGIAKITKELVIAASDAEEVRNKFDVVFRDISDQAESSARNLSDNYGLSSNAAKSLIADTGDLLTGFGFTQDAALDLSDQVNTLAVDLASFTNFTGGAEGASQALTKALLGERDSIKALGISILEEDVKAKVLENTKKGLIFETERQAKAYATLQLAQEQSKNAIGDFSRSIDSYANQSRIAAAATEDLKVAIGESFLPIAAVTVSAYAEMVKGLTAYTERMKNFRAVTKDLKDGTQDQAASQQELLDTYNTIIAKISALSIQAASSNGITSAIAKGKIKTLNEELVLVEALITSYGVKDNFNAKAEGEAERTASAAIEAARVEAERNKLAIEAADLLLARKEALLTDEERQIKSLGDQIEYWVQFRDIAGVQQLINDLVAERNALLEESKEVQEEVATAESDYWSTSQTNYDKDKMFRDAVAAAQERQIADTKAQTDALKEQNAIYISMTETGVKSLLASFEDLGEAFIAGELGWDDFGRAGLNAIAAVLEALGSQLAAQAAVLIGAAFFSGGTSLAGLGATLAGSASAYAAAGIVRGLAGTFEQGGVVPEIPGASPAGDKQLIAVNGGERILPKDAQQAIIMTINLDGEAIAKSTINNYVNKRRITIVPEAIR